MLKGGFRYISGHTAKCQFALVSLRHAMEKLFDGL